MEAVETAFCSLQGAPSGLTVSQALALSPAFQKKVFRNLGDTPLQPTNQPHPHPSQPSQPVSILSRSRAESDERHVQDWVEPIAHTYHLEEGKEERDRPIVLRRANGDVVKFHELVKGCGFARPKINSQEIAVMIDSGSETNLMDSRVARDLGLYISPRAGLTLKGINAGADADRGTVLDAPIVFGPATIFTDFIIKDGLELGVILGRPWEIKAQFSKKESSFSNGKACWDCTVTDTASGMLVGMRLPTVPCAEAIEMMSREAELYGRTLN